jgi:uncharacterized membrane protein (UPF0127 family)|tara:strand:+ start:269 stop:592 length:324 start_codon:yes stop_codon:yes gene_type:complete
MIDFGFEYSGKNFNLGVKECKNFISQSTGLMFRKKSKPLLFIFKKPKKRTIHSFFCLPFIAIWFNEERIIGIKKVMPWNPLVKPKEKYDKLLEIPLNNKNFLLFSRR